MKILGINSALPVTEISLIEGGRTLLNKNWHSDYNEAEKMIPEIIEAVKTKESPGAEGALNPIPSAQISLIFVVSGPGSYTGLRIGVTAANTVGMLTHAPVASLNTFDYLHARISGSKFPQNNSHIQNTAVILKAGGLNVALTFKYGEKPLQMPQSELPDYLKQERIVRYYTEREAIATEIMQANPEIQQIQYTDLLPFDRFLQKLSELNLTPQKLIQPIYLNPPAITKSKK